MGFHVARLAEERNVYMLLVVEPEGKRQLGRRRHRMMSDMDWIDVAEDRV
jgi:hypothetical protein